jgi:hypothetical protein
MWAMRTMVEGRTSWVVVLLADVPAAFGALRSVQLGLVVRVAVVRRTVAAALVRM